jgi:hypothetical protein
MSSLDFGFGHADSAQWLSWLQMEPTLMDYTVKHILNSFMANSDFFAITHYSENNLPLIFFTTFQKYYLMLIQPKETFSLSWSLCKSNSLMKCSI